MPRAGRLFIMDTVGYSKWDGGFKDVPGGCWGRRLLLLALALLVTTALWALILSILLSRASMQRGELLGRQNLLRANASEQTAALGALKDQVGACHSCCLSAQAQLKTARAELDQAQLKLIQQASALEELSQRVTKSLAEAGRDREEIRSELFRALEAVRVGNSSCGQCPASWLLFQGSCYLFAEEPVAWAKANRNCEDVGAHLVIVGNLEEQSFLTRNTRGRGYWLGLQAVRRANKIQGYQWVDGVPLSFSHWNQGEPNDSRGHEDCVMMLHTGLWNDAPCDSVRDPWICEKRLSC